ncbi:MAG: hypothetical protein NKF70_02390 [Methanobacterium sp. ERen5]|nr:MAG: hypothetical protein NKF70_02390 [Methanobacterium sp. ERen5]
MKIIQQWIVVIFIITILIAVSGCIISNTTQNESVNATGTNINSNSNNSTNYISASKAKELAVKYNNQAGASIGSAKLTPETPKLSTYQGIKVWIVPIYNSEAKSALYSIYINAQDGSRVS